MKNNYLQKWYSHSRERNNRAEAIRQRIMKAEQFKMQNIDGYVLEAYDIETMPIVYLLQRYGLQDEYNTDEYSEGFLLLLNKSAMNDNQ